jgi:hypothetical protein
MSDMTYENGSNALYYAVLFASEDAQLTVKLDVLRFLLSEGADPNVEDDFGQSARDTAITGVLISQKESAYIRMLKVLFCISYDEFNYVGFTRLHKAVLGIIPADIGADLQRMDSEFRQQVNERDAWGFSSLDWCVKPVPFAPFSGLSGEVAS